MRDLRKFQGHDASAFLHVATAASTCEKLSLMQECGAGCENTSNDLTT